MTNTKRFYNKKNHFLYTDSYKEDCIEKLKRKVGLDEEQDKKRTQKEKQKILKFDLLINV
ncbi:MAG: hypothetical protein ACOC44_00260 [Promethearchaeia archaeon]